MDAAAIYASHPLETHGVEELALEATQEHHHQNGEMVPGSRTSCPRQFLHSCDRPHLQERDRERAVDKLLRVAATSRSRLATQVWSKADDMPAELEELRLRSG